MATEAWRRISMKDDEDYVNSSVSPRISFFSMATTKAKPEAKPKPKEIEESSEPLLKYKMHPANGNDAWGGFKLGPNGLESYNEDLYHTRLCNEAFMELVYDTYESNHRRMFYMPELQREVVRHINKSLNIKTQYLIQIKSSENLYGDVMNHVTALGGNIWSPPGVNLAQVPVQVPAQGVPEMPEDLSNSIAFIPAPSVTPPPVVYINSEFDDEEDHVEPSESVELLERQFDLNED